MNFLSRAAVGTVAVLFGACTPRSTSQESPGEAASVTEPAHLALGATKEQALDGLTSDFVFESTPDLVLHATLRDATHEGQTLRILGTDAHGTVAWSYPHAQKGLSFDAVLPVFGSSAARKRVTGAYSFEVVAPDRTVVARGAATFRSTRGEAGDGGAAFHRVAPGQDLGATASGE